MNSTPDEPLAPPAEDAPAPSATATDESAPAQPADEQLLAAQPADEQLLAAHDQARAALIEITPAATIGDPAGYTVEEGGVVSLRFENRLSGYPGWFWTVSMARVEDADPTVLEVELLPGEDALLAPDWVSWAVRLADYHAAQEAIAEANAAAGIVDGGEAVAFDADDLDGDDLSDLDDLDAVDFDGDGSPILHAGDVDGVDIDELDVIDIDELDVIDIDELDVIDIDELDVIDIDELDDPEPDSDDPDSDSDSDSDEDGVVADDPHDEGSREY